MDPEGSGAEPLNPTAPGSAPWKERFPALLRSWWTHPRARLALVGCALATLALLALGLWGVRRVPAGWVGVWGPDRQLAEPGSVYFAWSAASLDLYPKWVKFEEVPLRVGVGGMSLRGSASLRGELLPEVARAIASRRADDLTPERAAEQAILQALSETLGVRDSLELVESSPFSLETAWLSVAGMERGLRVESSEIDLVSVSSLRTLASLLIQTDGMEAADAFLVSVMSRRPGDPVPVCVRADLARLRGETKRAELLYLEALELDPLMPEPMAVLAARASQRPDELERSERLLRRALQIKPNSLRHLNWLSLVLAQRGDLRGAEAALVRALAIEPSSPGTAVNLAALYDRQGQRDKAVSRLRQALEHHPDEPMLLYNLGSALAADGDLQGALQALQLAERASPPSARLYARLASVHEMLGNADRAEAYRRRAEEVGRSRTKSLIPEEGS